MKRCSKCKEKKPLDAFGPWNTSGKMRLQSYCKTCSRKYYFENRVRISAQNRIYAAKHKQEIAKYHERYVVDNRDRLKARAGITGPKWRAANKARINARRKEWEKNNQKKARALRASWQKQYPEKVRAFAMQHRASQLRAIPRWANEFLISEIYDLAVRRTKLLGTEWEVDHIVPLQSPLVCGLHTEQNLRVVPRTVNRTKSNVVWPDMP